MKTLILVASLMSLPVWAAVETGAENPAPNVKYKAGKDVNFEELLIQGQLKRPEISVITGNGEEQTNGLLRLREKFTDRMAMDAGEDAQ